MNAAVEIRQKAELFGWQRHATQDQHDVLVHGDKMIDVEYRGDGAVLSAERYWFFSIDNLELRDRTGSAGKKGQVIAWLAEAA